MKETWGLYLHIPFCRSRCRYCSFFSTLSHHRVPDFLAALKKEISLCGKPRDISIESLYFGGGTPSVLEIGDLAEIFRMLDSSFHIPQDAEITLEANPGTLSVKKLEGLKSLGINRLSLGLQSLCDEKLRFLGRPHDAAQGRLAYEMARRTGFNNISLDFIYGLPAEPPFAWQKELEGAADLQPEHLSLYMLGIEEGTPMGSDLAAGYIPAPDEEMVADLFRLTLSLADSLGYPWYEVSNFARSEELRSKHNRGYWEGRPWLAFGPAAHGFLNAGRFANVSNLDDYIRILLSENRLPREMEEEITPEKARIEALYLGFRTRKGIDVQAFDAMFGSSFAEDYDGLIRRYAKNGFLVCDSGFCRLTAEGMLFLDAIAADFAAVL